MKTIQKIKFLSFLLLGLIVSSCVQDDDFQAPNVSYEEPDIDEDQIITVSSAIAFYGGYEPVQITAGENSDEPVYLEGYVVSSDESGNFYKTLIIQDKPEDPTAGIAISTEANDLYTSYEPGRKIYLRVDGLYSGEYANLPTIGVQDDDEVGRIGEIEFYDRIKRTGTVEELVPTLVTIGNLSNTPLNTLIQLEGVQFPSELNGASFGNINNTFNVNRVVENCEEEQIIIRNSGFSDFKNKLLPTGNGTLVAVLSVYNNDTQLFIRDEDDVMFNGERCPEPYFIEDFDDITSTGPGVYIDLEGWTNVNVSGGSSKFEARDFGGNTYAQISAYNTGESPLEAWLVTPAIDLSQANSVATLRFSTKDGYNNGEGLTAFVATDFSGDVNNANWVELPAIIATGSTSGYASNYTNSGDLDLSDYIGEDVYVAFRYTGDANTVTTTYQIDNISISIN